MKVWKQFDVDCSGYIEADELKQFVKTLLTKRQGNKITEEKLIEYTDTIVCRKNGFSRFYFILFIL
jgi:Ca2+-binding EF-hand superfamily protein